MSSYLEPNEILPVFNPANFNYSTSLTLQEANARYLQLTGGTETGVVTFSAGLASTEVATPTVYNDSYSSLSSATWTANSPTVLTAGTWTSIVFAQSLNLYVAVGDSCVATSVDGVNFTSINPGAGLSTTYWRCVIWISELSLFVACASNGSSRIMTSTDGSSWTGYTGDATSSWNSLTYSPSLGIIVAVATSGTNRIMTSPTGSSWTVRTPPNTNSWDAVAWSPSIGKFVSVSSSNAVNKAMYSSNGTAWTATTMADESSSNGALWNKVIWASGLSLFIACANGSVYGSSSDPVLATSSNGTGWNAVGGSSTTLYKLYKSLVYLHEQNQVLVLANDASAITTYISSAWASSSSSALTSLNWSGLVWNSVSGQLVALSSGPARGAYSNLQDSLIIPNPRLVGTTTSTFLSILNSLNAGQASVVQTGSNNDTVNINSVSGKIQLFGSIGGLGSCRFAVNNSCCTSSSIVLASVHQSPAMEVILVVFPGIASNGSFIIQVNNTYASATTNPIVITFLLC